MKARTKVLGQLIRDSQYVVDERAVADSIILRSLARQLVPDLAFSSPLPTPAVRSFRRTRGARSFRLEGWALPR